MWNLEWKCLVVCCGCVAVLHPHDSLGGDWPQWGGTSVRNMVSAENDLPTTFDRGKRKNGVIDLSTTENVRWVTELGTNAYGNPTVAQGRVFVGTDGDSIGDDDRFPQKPAGVMKCLSESDGSLLWQLIIPNRVHGLPDSQHFGLQHFGVCSSAAIDGDRVYVVTSAADIVCLDIDGLADGNDGPFQSEAQYMAGHGKHAIELTDKDADILWRFDPVDQLAVCPHDAASCSILIDGDVLYTGTSNGVGGDKGSHWTRMHDYVVNPEAPAFIALDKNTGRLLAVEDAGISSRLWHAQWSSPSLGVVHGKKLIFLGGGDGWCYAFEALESCPPEPTKLKLAWKYDCNPPEYRFRDGQPIDYYEGDRRQEHSTNENDGNYLGPSQLIATPVFHNNRVYVAIGQDPAHGRGRGLLHCIDATQSGDVTKTACVWKYDRIERTMSTVAIQDNNVYVPDLSGIIHCLDADTGQCRWTFDTAGETWGCTLLADHRLYLGNKRHFCVVAAGEEPQLISKIRLGAPIYSTAIAVNRTLYVATGHHLWAIAQDP
jgi:outer membrane protein assembly factor BamB